LLEHAGLDLLGARDYVVAGGASRPRAYEQAHKYAHDELAHGSPFLGWERTFSDNLRFVLGYAIVSIVPITFGHVRTETRLA
jgi:hypothetical protein